MRRDSRLTTHDRRLLPLAALLLAAASCRPKAASEPPGVPVRVQDVSTASGIRGIRYSANVIPRAQVDVAFKANGYVDVIRQVKGADGRARDLQPGDVVARGSMLARLRDTDYVDNVTKARANLDKSNAALEKSTNDFRRASNLQATNSITGPDYDSAKQEYETAKAAVDGAKAQLNEAQTSLGYTTLTAPMNGTLLQRKIEVGDLVSPGGTGFVMADVSTVKVVFGVPDVMLNRVKLGSRIQISTASVPGKFFTGIVTTVSPSADASTRVSDIEVSVPNASGELRDGMVASLEVPGAGGPAAAARAEAIAVPLAAVVQSKPGASTYAVFVVTSDGKKDLAKLHPVELGQVVGNSVIVNSGLEPGSRVIVTGATIVRDGDTVRPIQ
jgi:RND family efflux transporter MFP subunit